MLLRCCSPVLAGESGGARPSSLTGVWRMCEIGRGELPVRWRVTGGGVGSDLGGRLWFGYGSFDADE